MDLITKNYITGYTFSDEEVHIFELLLRTHNISYIVDINYRDEPRYYSTLLKRYLEDYYYDYIEIYEVIPENERNTTFGSLEKIEKIFINEIDDFDTVDNFWVAIKEIDLFFDSYQKVNLYHMYELMQSRDSIYEEKVLKFLKDEHNNMVTICGSWGIGKTTLINKIIHESNNKEVRFFYNDMSAIEIFSNNISYLFLHFIFEIIESEINELVKKENRDDIFLKIAEISREILSSFIKLTPLGIIPNSLFRTLWGTKKINIKEAESQILGYDNFSGMRNVIDIYVKFIRELNKIGINPVFIFDDLDRCMPDSVINFIKTINYLNSSIEKHNIQYKIISIYNREIVTSLLFKQYGVSGEAFLEKWEVSRIDFHFYDDMGYYIDRFLQLYPDDYINDVNNIRHFSTPEIKKRHIAEYIRLNSFTDINTKEAYIEFLTLLNIREVKRFCKEMVDTLYNISEENFRHLEKLDPQFFVVLNLLKIKYPELYRTYVTFIHTDTFIKEIECRTIEKYTRNMNELYTFPPYKYDTYRFDQFCDFFKKYNLENEFMVLDLLRVYENETIFISKQTGSSVTKTFNKFVLLSIMYKKYL